MINFVKSKYLRLLEDWNNDSAEKGNGAEVEDDDDAAADELLLLLVEDVGAIDDVVLTAGGGIGEANTGGWNVECCIPAEDIGGGVGCEGLEIDVAGEWIELVAWDL